MVDAIDSNFRCRQFDFKRVRWKGSDERHQFFILTVTVCAITGTVFQWQLNARYNIDFCSFSSVDVAWTIYMECRSITGLKFLYKKR